MLDDRLGRIAPGKLLQRAFEFTAAQRIGARAQVLDDRDRTARLDPFLEVAHAALDDRLRLCDGGQA
jgi:hypothetical protein